MATIAQDNWAGHVTEFWNKAHRALETRRCAVWVNRSFYLGHQWLWWDRHKTLRTYREANPSPRRQRAQINLIGPRVDMVLGRMLGRSLTFEARPYGADDASLGAGRLAEVIIDDLRHRGDWEAIRAINLFNTIVDSTAAVSIEWDPASGRRIYADQSMGEIHEGDVVLRPFSLLEFSVEPGSRSWQDSTRWVSCRLMPVEQVAEAYNLDEVPRPSEAFNFSALQREIALELGAGSFGDNLTEVYTYWERPTSRRPEGAHVVVVGRQTVYAGPWPFPWTDRLNLYVFRQKQVAGRWWGRTYLDDALYVQVAYNQLRTNIHEHLTRTANARLWVEAGSLDESTNLTDLPGEVAEYHPGTSAPFFASPPQLPRWMTYEHDRLLAEMDDITYAHALARGVPTGDRMAGYAIAQLTERNDTPLGVMAQDQAKGWAELASMALELYQANVVLPRDAGVNTSDGVPVTIRWTGQHLMGQTRMYVPAEATQPQSKAALIAQVTQLQQSFPMAFKDLTREQLAKVVDLPGGRLLNQVTDSDAACAMAENHLIAAGEVPVPQRWHDHARHLKVLNDWRNSAAYRNASPEVRQVADMHALAHQRLLEEEIVKKVKMSAALPGAGEVIPQADNIAGVIRPETPPVLEGT